MPTLRVGVKISTIDHWLVRTGGFPRVIMSRNRKNSTDYYKWTKLISVPFKQRV